MLDVVIRGVSARHSKVARHTDSLSHGTAGDILSLIHFQKTLNKGFLNHQLEMLTDQLLKNAKHSSYGAYWEDVFGNKNGLSFISGNLGIYHALTLLFRHFKADTLEEYLVESKRFITNVYQKYWSTLSFLDRCYISINVQDQIAEFGSNGSILRSIIPSGKNTFETRCNTITNITCGPYRSGIYHKIQTFSKTRDGSNTCLF